VEWLGEVPGHWSVTALKRGFDVTLGKMLQPDSTGSEDELLPYLRAANIHWEGVDSTDIKLMWLTKRDREQLRLAHGDLLISEGGDVGRSCMWAAELEHCYFQNSVNRVRARDGHSNRYLYYWMSTVKDKGYIDVLCNKSTIAHFTAEKVAAVPVPLPTSVEQTQIAGFLDRETAKIDALVAEQRRLMALLKEKRQAVISHAVTRGLNPDAPMKPSGIEWLGDVPAHWGIGALGYLSSIQTGSTPDRAKPEYWEGDIPWLKTGEINYELILDSEERITELGLANSTARIAEVGTLMMAMYGQGVTRGRVAILGIRAAFNQACAAITFGPKLFNEYAKYFFTMAYRFIRDTGNETSQMNLGSGTIAKIKILIPPMEEQRQIVRLLQIELSVFDTLTTEAQRAIDLLQERRTALISAAVTGQIDVRGAV